VAGAASAPYPSGMNTIVTRRLELIPATAELVRAEMDEPERFCDLLGVVRADDWPSENLQAVLPLFLDELRDPANVGWLCWYWIDRAENALVGGGGFKGRPSTDGAIEIGYETRPAYRRRGYASEGVAALVNWAFSQMGVRRVVAETAPDNAGSIGVLLAAGFERTGPGSEPELVAFERIALSD